MINRFKIMLLISGLFLSSSTSFAWTPHFLKDEPTFYILPSNRRSFERAHQQEMMRLLLEDMNQSAREANQRAIREMERSDRQHQDNLMAMQRLQEANRIAMQEIEGYMRREYIQMAKQLLKRDAIMQETAKIMAMIMEKSRIQNQVTYKEHQ